MKRTCHWRYAASLLMLCVVLVGCGGKSTYKPGTYEGSGKGYTEENPIRLSVTIGEDGAIYEIRVLEHKETEKIGGKALEQLIEDAKKNNTADVDSVSGATRTSEGFRAALREALEQAK